MGKVVDLQRLEQVADELVEVHQHSAIAAEEAKHQILIKLDLDHVQQQPQQAALEKLVALGRFPRQLESFVDPDDVGVNQIELVGCEDGTEVGVLFLQVGGSLADRVLLAVEHFLEFVGLPGCQMSPFRQ